MLTAWPQICSPSFVLLFFDLPLLQSPSPSPSLCGLWNAQGNSREVIDGNSSAPVKGNSHTPLVLFLHFLFLDSLFTCYLHRLLRDRRPATADEPTSHNYESQVMGLRGDDDEDMDADTENCLAAVRPSTSIQKSKDFLRGRLLRLMAQGPES